MEPRGKKGEKEGGEGGGRRKGEKEGGDGKGNGEKIVMIGGQ